MFKAKKKIQSLFVALCTLIVTAIMAVSMITVPTTSITASAADGAWTLVTDVSTLKAEDKVVIVAKDSNYALSTTQNGNNRAQVAVTKSNDKNTVTWTTAVQELTLRAGTKAGTFAFYTGSGYLYAASSGSNYLRTETTLSANSSWKITIASTGVATIVAQGSNTRNTMQHNSSSSIFACYGSASQKAICLYKWVEATSGGDEPKESFELRYEYPSAVKFSGTENTVTVEDGTIVDLPTTDAPKGYVFAGWSEEEISQATTTKPTLYEKTYTVKENTTLYAVYRNDVEAGGWNLVTSPDSLATGDTVTIVCPTKNVAIGAVSGNYFTGVSISIANNAFADVDGVSKLTLTVNDNGSYSFKTTTAKYLALTSAANALHTADSIADTSSWTVKFSGNNATINNVEYTDRNLKYNSSSPRFACYTTAQTAVAIYKYTEGAEISYTSIFCEHSETTTNTEAATCTQDGLITVTCGKCGMAISTEVISATGHLNTTEVTTPATCTEAGKTVKTCNDCSTQISSVEIPSLGGHDLDDGVITIQPAVGVEGEITYTCQRENCDYTETEKLPALDATKYMLSYSVPEGVVAPESVELTVNETIILSAAVDYEGFTFVGWATEECNNKADAPEALYLAESEYTLEEEGNVTLYALYSYSTGSSNWTKVTEAKEDWSGEYLIVYEAGKVAFNGGLETLDAVSNTISVAISNNEIEANDATKAATFTIAKSGSNYTIKSASGYYVGQTSDANGLRSNKTTTYANTITINSDGSVNFVSGGAYLRYNAAVDQTRFRYYKSSSYTSQKAISLYSLEGKVCYTTDVSAKFGGANLTIGDEITLNYYVTMPELYADAIMHFTVEGLTNVVESVGELQADGRYKYSLPLAPQCMASNIVAELRLGDEVIASKDYSVTTYAQSKLNNTDSSAELKRLVSDLLYYGAAAQNYTNFNTENLATAVEGILEESTEATPAETDFTLTKNEEISSFSAWFAGAGVQFSNVNKIYVKLSLLEEATLENVTLTINGETVEVEDATIYLGELKATQFGTVYTFVLSYDGVVMQTLTYSVNSYAYSMQNKDTTMGKLALALYRYGASAAAYNA